MKKSIINIKSIGAVIIVMMIIVMFYSQTLYSYGLPIVTGASPSNGKLSKSESATGIVEWADVQEMYSEIAGKVSEILVSEGDKVEKGQPLFLMTFDEDDVKTKLRELEISRGKLALDIAGIQASLERTYQSIAELEAEIYEKDAVSDYDESKQLDNISKAEEDLQRLKEDRNRLNDEYWAIAREYETYGTSIEGDLDLIKQQDKITQAEENLQKQQMLFNVGAVTANELATAEYDLSIMRKDYENMVETKTKSKQDGLASKGKELENKAKEIENKDKEIRNSEYDLNARYKEYENLLITKAESSAQADESIESKENERQKKLRDYQYDINNYERNLQAKQYDLANYDIQESSYLKTLEEYAENMTVYAPTSGTILTISIKTGQNINNAQLIMDFGVGTEYKILCNVSLENNFITVNDTCKIKNSTNSATGTVTKITPSANAKELTVIIESDVIAPGETFTLTFEKQSTGSYQLVPNGAVNMDNDGYFVYVIKKRQGILGDEYYAAKSPIYIGDSDNTNTIVTSGLGFFDPIIVLSNKPFSESQTVKVKNEGDFFAK